MRIKVVCISCGRSYPLDMCYCPRCNVVLDTTELDVVPFARELEYDGKGKDVYDYREVDNILQIKKERR